MDTGTNIPHTLRHLLSKGATSAQQQQQQQMYEEYQNMQSPMSVSATLPASQASLGSKLTSVGSSGNLKTGGSLGAWLTKYHLRPNLSRSSVGNLSGGPSTNSLSSQSTTSMSGRTHVDATKVLLANKQQQAINSSMAYAAYITSVETREQTGGGLRMGRKKYLVYRILVTGRAGQWWIARRYNEFTDLHQALKRAFPQHAVHWAELPARRLIGGRGASADAAMQRREKLNPVPEIADQRQRGVL
ncbi:hypothetical protein DL89DRAFT_91069 [Linderina pennispora]|uniref:PX domain-containing protein n=1 Tax=Linderina pennispora TaxID=61395 RepID=A0A1Y1WIW2_9FUNG|nr:uncharacterized protein DL89DRAFT_91069 [Linderina pennispora]ORX73305.1 hypothetical protein DL89DRAFT_91069 [Linderina pennispora]